MRLRPSAWEGGRKGPGVCHAVCHTVCHAACARAGGGLLQRPRRRVRVRLPAAAARAVAAARAGARRGGRAWGARGGPQTGSREQPGIRAAEPRCGEVQASTVASHRVGSVRSGAAVRQAGACQGWAGEWAASRGRVVAGNGSPHEAVPPPSQADRIHDWIVSQLAVDDGLKQVASHPRLPPRSSPAASASLTAWRSHPRASAPREPLASCRRPERRCAPRPACLHRGARRYSSCWAGCSGARAAAWATRTRSRTSW
jgi:hypothetical protein